MLGFEARCEGISDALGTYENKFQESERLTSIVMWYFRRSRSQIKKRPERDLVIPGTTGE